VRLHERVAFITGAGGGIGQSTVKRFLREGAKVIACDRDDLSLQRLKSSLSETHSLHLRSLDVSSHEDVERAVKAGLGAFGQIDILINNASAISLTPTPTTTMKRFDLMFDVDVRGTFACTQACLAALIRSAEAGRNPHILNLSPPLSMKARWFAPHVAYTMAKYGMSMCTLGHASEFRRHGIGVNSLWPRTLIATAALQMIPGLDTQKCRKPEILADAAWLILTSDARAVTGNFFIDQALLGEHGVTDLDRYAVAPGTQDLMQDLFVD